jgi:hypothetical protein
MSTFQTITEAEIRRAYNGGRATGRADVAGLGLTYAGKAITALEFGRHGRILYVGVGGVTLAAFGGACVLDD